MGPLQFGGERLGWDEALARQVEEMVGPEGAKKVIIQRVDLSWDDEEGDD